MKFLAVHDYDLNHVTNRVFQARSNGIAIIKPQQKSLSCESRVDTDHLINSSLSYSKNHHEAKPSI